MNGLDALLPDLLEKIKYFLADKAYDAQERVLDLLAKFRVHAVIPPKSNRKDQRDYDKDLYKARALIENFFAKLKQFRGLATRYDKTAAVFLGGVHLAAVVILLN